LNTVHVVRIEEAVLVHIIIVREAVESVRASCHCASIRAIVEFAEIFERSCPWIGRVKKRWIEHVHVGLLARQISSVSTMCKWWAAPVVSEL
jgi:hypothetical protein